MNIQALKLTLDQQLVGTDDAKVLTKLKRLLDVLRSGPEGTLAERDEELLAAANLFGTTAYSEYEPDINELVVKERTQTTADEAG
ncbi:MAG: hypothetical protein KF843_03165 [Flavobacteriales bacterium]|nr:hypothetical protein [Flavobacteriales bacterium]